MLFHFPKTEKQKQKLNFEADLTPQTQILIKLSHLNSQS